MPSKTFNVATIMAVINNRMTCLEEEYVALVRHLVGQPDLGTHQMLMHAKECADHLREQFPDIAAIDIPAIKLTSGEGIDWVMPYRRDHRDVASLPTPANYINPFYHLLIEMQINAEHFEGVKEDARG